MLYYSQNEAVLVHKKMILHGAEESLRSQNCYDITAPSLGAHQVVEWASWELYRQ